MPWSGLIPDSRSKHGGKRAQIPDPLKADARRIQAAGFHDGFLAPRCCWAMSDVNADDP